MSQPVRNPDRRAALFRASLGSALLGLSLVLPKGLLLAFARTRLWVSLGPLDVIRALASDTALALLVVAVARAATRRGALAKGSASLATGALLALLLLDARVRELWLKPLDLELARYALRYADDLSSGASAFLHGQAGLGLTFRRAAALALALHGLAWGLLLSAPVGRPARNGRALAIGVALLIAVAASAGGALPYRLEGSPFVRHVLDAVARAAAVGSRDEGHGAPSELPPRPLSGRLGVERRLGAGARPFRNAVVLSFESCRWAGLDLEGEGATPVPLLRRLGHEGWIARCRVAVPHSSKALYAVATGCAPWPGIEMRETVRGPEAPWLRAFARERGACSWVFSVESLEFEGLGTLLRGAGFEKLVGPGDLLRLSGGGGSARSSFSEDDALLAPAPAALLAASSAPFFALFVTGSSHYPYAFPGKSRPEDASWESYTRALSYADGRLGDVLASLDTRGLLDDTLVVIVGDHGESFGEHATFIHNNSLHEEETVVPLVFWSKDGRLGRARLEARQIDVSPTVADLLGLRGDAALVEGVSLARSAPGPTFSGTFFDGVAEALVDGQTKWIHDPPTGRLVRFDLAADPSERSGVAVLDPAERSRTLGRLASHRAQLARTHGERAGLAASSR